jgi:hypothetical protein
MPESLEEYLQRLLQQAMEKKSPGRQPAPVVEAEVVELVEVPAPQTSRRPGEPFATSPLEAARQADERLRSTEGALAAELRVGGDRPLGNLGATTTDAETAATLRAKTIVDEIVTLFHSPGGPQKALVLSEILQRPEDRWQG